MIDTPLVFANSQYDVYVTAPGTDATRRSTVPRLIDIYKLDRARQDALVRGERILLRAKVTDAAAQRIVNDLRALGYKVDLEARHASLEAVEIDSTADEPATERPASLPAMDNPLFDVGAGLVGIDGEDDERPRGQTASSAPSTGVDSLLGLFGARAPTLGDVLVDEEPAPKPTRRPPPPPIAARPPAAAPIAPSAPIAPAPPIARPAASAPASPFRPSGLDDEASQITLDRTPAMHAEAQQAAAAATDTVEAPRCPNHDVVKVRGRCPQCDAEEAYVKSRLMGGQLRQKPQLRIAIGVGAGLLLGWIVTSPMSRHGEMRVQDLRDQAQRERERPTDEGQARAAQLEQEADDEAQSEQMKALGVWGLITAAVTGVWLKLS